MKPFANLTFLCALLLAACGPKTEALAVPTTASQTSPGAIATISPTPTFLPTKSPSPAPTETQTEPVNATPTQPPEPPMPPGNLHSPSLAEGGEMVAFVSLANPPGGAFTTQVLLYDAPRAQTLPVGETSRWPALTADGRFLAYEVAAGDEWVYVYDVSRGETEVVSISSDGVPADAHSGQADISADGRFVVFFSDAGNLDPQDRNGTWDIYLRDRQAKATVLVSRVSGGGAGNDSSQSPVISADGSTIAFWSWASDLVPDDNELCGPESEQQNCGDVFIYERESGALERVAAGEINALGRNGYSLSLSADGRYLAFYESVYDRQSGQLASICVPGEELHCAYDPRLSADGSQVAYSDGQVWIYDRKTGQRRLVSAALNGSPANGQSGRVFHYEGFFGSLDLSPDGRWLAFSSTATNLVPGDTRDPECLDGPIPPYGVPGCYALYLYDLETGTTTRIQAGP